jgi:L-ascorbate metabolism protein UlaG (beta-lactamase superfamily)
MIRVVQIAVVIAVLTGLSLARPSPAGAQDGPVVQKLADNVYSIFSVFYNSIVVIGEDGVLITDPANAYRAGLLKAEIAKLTDKPVTAIVLTHEHFDHTGGTEQYEGAEIIAQENVAAVFRFDPLGAAPDKVHVTFSDRHVIDMGTTTVELRHFGAGDGVATTVVHLPAEKIVATADLYDDGRLTLGAFLDDKNMIGTRAILNEVAGWDLMHAVNAHSTGTDPEILRANAAYYNALYDAVYPIVEDTAKNNPAGLWELPASLPQTVKLPDYESWDGYDQLPHHVRRMVLAIIHGG